MALDPESPNRQSLRLKSYDYSVKGAYFVTIVTQNRACLFGAIQNEIMTLSPAGEMLQSVWEALPTRFPNIELDASVIMPNHFHGIITFPVGVGQRVPTRGTPTDQSTLGTVVGAWKSLTTVEYVAGVKTRGWTRFAGRLWQRNYYEHVVRDHDDLARIRYYIDTNPRYWLQDAENPQQIASKSN